MVAVDAERIDRSVREMEDRQEEVGDRSGRRDGRLRRGGVGRQRAGAMGTRVLVAVMTGFLILFMVLRFAAAMSLWLVVFHVPMLATRSTDRPAPSGTGAISVGRTDDQGEKDGGKPVHRRE